jgi:hypothetical protein
VSAVGVECTRLKGGFTLLSLDLDSVALGRLVGLVRSVGFSDLILCSFLAPKAFGSLFPLSINLALLPHVASATCIVIFVLVPLISSDLVLLSVVLSCSALLKLRHSWIALDKISARRRRRARYSFGLGLQLLGIVSRRRSTDSLMYSSLVRLGLHSSVTLDSVGWAVSSFSFTPSLLCLLLTRARNWTSPLRSDQSTGRYQFRCLLRSLQRSCRLS